MSEEPITTPILIWAKRKSDFEALVRRSRFLPHEVQHIAKLESLTGFKNKLMLMYDFPPAAVIDYANTHNIRMVRL